MYRGQEVHSYLSTTFSVPELDIGAPFCETSVVPKLSRSLVASLCLLMRPDGAGGVLSRRLEGDSGRPMDGVPGIDPGVTSPRLSGLERGVPRTADTKSSTSARR